MLITDFNFHVTDCVEQNRLDPSRMRIPYAIRGLNKLTNENIILRGHQIKLSFQLSPVWQANKEAHQFCIRLVDDINLRFPLVKKATIGCYRICNNERTASSVWTT